MPYVSPSGALGPARAAWGWRSLPGRNRIISDRVRDGCSIMVGMGRQLAACGVLLTTLALGSCERPPDVEDPQVFDCEEFSFSAPGNWTVRSALNERNESRIRREVHVQTPGRAWVKIILRSPPTWATADEFLAEFDRAAERTFGRFATFRAKGHPAPVVELINGVETEGRQLSASFAIGGWETPWRIRAFRLEDENTAVFVVASASESGWEMLVPGFRLVFSTFRLAP